MTPNRTELSIEAGAIGEYYEWLKAAKNGDVLVYWVGDLQFDRSQIINPADLMRANERLQVQILDTIATRVFDDAKAGELRLTQKRLGDNTFEYRATRFRYNYPGEKQGSGVRNDSLVPA